MDSLHAIGFYASAALSIGGGLLFAFLPGRTGRGLAMAVVGLGIAGAYASLSAGFAGLVALVCYAGCAAILAGPRFQGVESGVGSAWRQLAAVGCAGLFALLAYAAFRGEFAQATFRLGAFDSAALGRLLLAHDALATEAVAALVMVSLVGATVAWRSRERGR
jgi:NADH:ubiquinone oxidoreductase subunit 6 (subunit J)